MNWLRSSVFICHTPQISIFLPMLKPLKILAVISLFLALGYSAFAADTTMVYANQLNHYYQFGAKNRFHQELGKFCLYNHISNASSIYSETSKLKTQSEISADVLYIFSPSVMMGFAGRYFDFRDGQTSHAYDYNQGRLGLKAKLKSKRYSISLQSGYAGETRLGIRDMGSYAGISLHRAEPDLLIYPNLDWDYSQMGDRRNYTFDNRVSFHLAKDSPVRNVFSAGIKAYNREYYVSREADTEERLNISTYLRNRLYYPIAEGFVLDYKVDFTSSNDGLSFLYYDKKEIRTRQFLGLQNDVRVIAKQGKFRATVGWINDYKQSRTVASNENISLPSDYLFNKNRVLAKLGWRISDKDSIRFNYLGSLLYYDTPDTNNYDDRDELSYSFSPVWQHRIDEHTRLSLSANAFLHHYVYLFHQRSAQNHWNRVFSIRSDISTNIPGKLSWNAKQELYANYFVYDHEDSAFVHVQSMVFRGLKLQQNIKYHFNARWFVNSYMFLRVEDNGLLDWDDFIQEITDSKFTIKLELAPGYQKGRHQIMVGPVFSFRQDFRYSDIEDREESNRSLRLGGMISLRLSNFLTLNYRLEQINQRSMARVYNQSGTLRFNYIF